MNLSLHSHTFLYDGWMDFHFSAFELEFPQSSPSMLEHLGTMLKHVETILEQSWNSRATVTFPLNVSWNLFLYWFFFTCFNIWPVIILHNHVLVVLTFQTHISHQQHYLFNAVCSLAGESTACDFIFHAITPGVAPAARKVFTNQCKHGSTCRARRGRCPGTTFLYINMNIIFIFTTFLILMLQ